MNNKREYKGIYHRKIELRALLKNMNGASDEVKEDYKHGHIGFCNYYGPFDALSFQDRLVIVEGFGEFECLEIPHISPTHIRNICLTQSDIGVGFNTDQSLWRIEFDYDDGMYGEVESDERN